MLDPMVSEQELEALRRFDTCMVCNAVERFDVRLRNTGFTDSRVRCLFGDLPPLVGYATTARLRSEGPPIENHSFHDRSDWWASVLEVPPPRIVVLQDMDEPPGRGALLGDAHAAILQALGCVGFVTNGAVRELPRIHDLGFHLFAGNVAVSHSYAHMFQFGAVVKVGGLEIHPGDLLHGDRHGLLSVPREIAARVPQVAAELRQKEEKVIAFCRSHEFSVERLRDMIRALD